jgi:cell division protease FtsH
VLRRLARRALGYSGADIERLVREARQKARREQRALTYADLDQLLLASRPTISPEKRRRIAVHEAGHVLARILLGLGELTAVTIDTASGGFTESTSPDDLVDTAEQCEHYLLVTMAGRAAEQVVYGSTLSGSGGFAHSDLAKATQLATAMEVSLGFGKRLPLLYRDPDHWQAMIRQDRELALHVHRRLDRAEAAARKLVRCHRSQLEMIADELEARGTLEGPELAALVKRVRAE